jgi:hypothetical protein
MKAYGAGLVWLSVGMIEVENLWTDLDETLYRRYAIGVYPKIVLWTNFWGGLDTSSLN